MVQQSKLALLVDFDETVAVQNVAELLLHRFGHKGWETLVRKYRSGEITFPEYQETAFRKIQASRQEMSRFVAEQATLRPGLMGLVAFCESHDIQLAIVTYGLDFYVQALLKRYQLHRIFQVYAVDTRQTRQGLQFLYRHANPECQQKGWGNCKCQVLERFRNDGRRIAYVGDGRTDYCPAGKADLVFARSLLLQHCHERGIRHREFQDFSSVLADLRDGTLAGI